ncbi:receptor-type tyrosine-protein phosphatase beta-like isoform X2 [Hyperolius riggenbachi]
MAEVTDNSVTLTWTPATGNMDFYVIRMLDNSTFYKTSPYENVTITELTPGKNYTFLVSTKLGDVEGAETSKSLVILPAPVINLTASKISNTTMNVSWLQPKGYRSYYQVDVVGDQNQTLTTTRESVIITNLTSGYQYTVMVTGVADDGSQGYPRDISLLVSDVISSTSITTTSVDLSWEPYAGVNATYRISVYGEPSSILTVNTTEVQITNLTCGNFYRIQISAYHDNSFLYGYGDEITLYTRPGAIVGDIQILNVSDTSFIVSWVQPDCNYSSFQIEVTGDITINPMKVYQSSQSIIGLTPGNPYTITIRTIAGENVQGEAKSKLVTTKPALVENLTIIGFTDTSVSLAWGHPKGNYSSYHIQIQEDGNYSKYTTSDFFTVMDLIPGIYYTFLVSAVTADKVEGALASASNYTQPGPVKNLTSETINTTAVSLTWEHPDGGEAFYKIEVTGDGAPYYTSFTTNNNSAVIGNLTAGNYYTFWVYAVIGEPNIPGVITNRSVYTKPEVVRNLTIENIGFTSMSLSWQVYGNATSYLIQVLEDPSYPKEISTTYYTAEGLTPGKNYTIRVTALAGTLQGDPAEISNQTLSGIVKNLKINNNTTTTSVSLSWEKPDGNATVYLIQIQSQPSFSKTVTTTYDTIVGLTPGNYYNFLVSTVVGENVTGATSNIPAYTMPGIVMNLMINNNTTTTSVSLSWEKPDGNATVYLIQIPSQPSFSKTVTTTYDTIVGLTPGNYYNFLVSAVVGENVTGAASNIPVYTMPGIVKNLMINNNTTTTSVSLSWEKPDGNATVYLIQIQSQPSFSKTVTTTYDTIVGLTPGNYYTFLVSAVVGENVTGAASNIPAYTMPGIVKNLMINNNTTITSVSLSWEKPDGNATVYLIQIPSQPSFSKTVTTTYDTIVGLTPGNYYNFLVSAVVGENVTGAASNIPVYTMPGIVKNLMINNNTTTTSVSLSWEKPDGNATVYLIQIPSQPSFSKTVTTTYDTIAGLTPGNYYNFLVSAVVGENVTGAASNIPVYTMPGIVKNLKINNNTTTTSVSLSWEKPDGNATVYLIQIPSQPSFSKTVTTTYDTIVGLTPGNYYNFLVSAVVGENVTGAASNIPVYTMPGIVKNLKINNNTTTTSVSLSWEKPDGNATVYLIQIPSQPSFSKTVTTTYDTIVGLTPGNYYTFLVSAVVGENVTGAASNIPVYTLPGIVKNLMINNNTTTTSVSLSWEKPDGNATVYLIQIPSQPSFSKTVTTTYDTIVGLTPGNYYNFLVSAVVGENVTGAASNIPVYTMPGIVKNLMINNNTTTTSVSLSWEKPDGNATVYLIQIPSQPSFSKTVTTTYDTIVGLTPGNYYNFLVSAVVGENVTGAASNIPVYTMPGIVKNLKINNNTTTTSVSLSWEKPDGNATVYLIQIPSQPSFSKTVTTTYDTIVGLTPGNYYNFLVSAVVGENVTGAASNIPAYTKPNVVKNLTVLSFTDTSVSLSWGSPSGNLSLYVVKLQQNASYSESTILNYFTVQYLTPGSNYTFLVFALAGNNTGGSSAISQYTKPGKVKNLHTLTITTTSISLSWQVPDGRFSTYQIQTTGNSANWTNVTTTNSITINNLVPGESYTLLVWALGDGSIQGDRESVSARTNAAVFMISITYKSSDPQNKSVIINQLNLLLQNRFPNVTVTAAYKEGN